MKVILLDYVEKLGKTGDVVEVNEGYARNFLFARSLAAVATKEKIQLFQNKLNKMKEKNDKELDSYKDIASKINGTVLVIEKKTTEDGKLFGGLSKKDVMDALLKKELNVEEADLDLSKVEKNIGKYEATVSWMHGEVEAAIIIEIKKS